MKMLQYFVLIIDVSEILKVVLKMLPAAIPEPYAKIIFVGKSAKNHLQKYFIFIVSH